MGTSSAVWLTVLTVFAVVWVLGWRSAWRYAASHPTLIRSLAVAEMIIFGGTVIGALLTENLLAFGVGILGFINGAVTYKTKRNWWRTPRQPRRP